MPERLITHLRHVDIAAPDFARQLDFYTSTWGLTRVGGDSGVAFLAAEGSPEQYVLRLREGDKRLDLIAFGAEDPGHVDLRRPGQLGACRLGQYRVGQHRRDRRERHLRLDPEHRLRR